MPPRRPGPTRRAPDRDRHDQLVKEILEAGARVKIIIAGEIGGAILAARAGTGVDVWLGTGGTAEGVVAACAATAVAEEIGDIIVV
jgi:fructose-1,6-bisphosphatase II